MAVPSNKVASKSMSSLILASQSKRRQKNAISCQSSSNLGFFNIRDRTKSNRKQRFGQRNAYHAYRVPCHDHSHGMLDELHERSCTELMEHADHANWFNMEDLISLNLVTESECDDQTAFFYDGQSERRVVFQHFDLNGINLHQSGASLDIVLNGYNSSCVPEIEHYFIVLYYNIQKSSVEQLHQLWSTLFHLVKHNHGYKNNNSQKRSVPPIYVDFQNGENPTNVQAVFDLLYSPAVNGVDMDMLREVVSGYYRQWNMKKIGRNERKEETVGIFSNFSSSQMVMERIDDHEEAVGYDRNEFMSMADFWTIDNEEACTTGKGVGSWKFPSFMMGKESPMVGAVGVAVEFACKTQSDDKRSLSC